MRKMKLKNIDPYDIEDLLPIIENSFGIKFYENELVNIKTFGEFCEYIENKIQLENVDDCTNQQAFYKLRDALSEILKKDKEEINPEQLIREVIPRNARKKVITQIEEKIDFDLNLLIVPDWLLSILLLLLFASIITLFFSLKLGVLGIIFSLISYYVSGKFAIIYAVNTIGQIAEKMTRENYLKSRRNSKTYNKIEIRKILTDIFSNELLIEKSELEYDAEF